MKAMTRLNRSHRSEPHLLKTIDVTLCYGAMSNGPYQRFLTWVGGHKAIEWGKTLYFKRLYTVHKGTERSHWRIFRNNENWVTRHRRKKNLSHPHPPISVRLDFQHWYTRRASWVCVFPQLYSTIPPRILLLNPNHDKPCHSSKWVALANRFRTAGPYHLSAGVDLGTIDLDQGFSNCKLNSMETSVFIEDLLRSLLFLNFPSRPACFWVRHAPRTG